MRNKLFCIACIFVAFAFLSCSKKNEHFVVDGKIDLQDYDFEKAKPVSLRGKWQFQYEDEEVEYAQVPSNWKHGFYGSKRSPYGLGVYSVKIVLPVNVKNLMFCIGEMGTASEVFIDDVLFSECGNFITPKVKNIYLQLPESVLQSNEINLKIKVSNFEDSNGGGMWGSVLIGSTEKIEALKNSSIIQDSFIAGIFFIVFILSLLLFLYRQKDFSLLLFSIICLLFIVRQISTNEKIILLFNSKIDWYLLVRLEYASLYTITPLYALFTYWLFPNPKIKNTCYAFVLIGAFFSISAWFFPVKFFISLLLYFQVYMVCLFVLCFSIAFVAARKKKTNSLLILISISVLILSGINDLLLSRIYISTVLLVTIGQAIFIVFQFLALSQKFNREYQRALYAEEMNIKLSEIDDAKTRFFTACSHELRIPVTLITTPVSAITSGKYGETINADSNVLKIIERNCFRLKRLADSLLDFLRFESGAASPVFTDFDLSVWLHSLSGIFSSDAECKNIFFENNFESEFGVRSDPVLLETVVINLLSNAIKHTPQTGKIVLSPVVQNGVRGFSVFNSGSEILSEQIPFLFERFKAASALGGTNYKGFGIGLPLSAEIVKALGGTIKAQNVKDGVLFTVILQNALTEHLEKISESKINNSSAITSSLQNETHNSKSKILIVDDTSDMLDFLCSVLSSEFDVKTAISAEDALTSVLNRKNGFALQRKIGAKVAVPQRHEEQLL